MTDEDHQQPSSQPNDQAQALPNLKSLQLLPRPSNDLLRRTSSENVIDGRKQTKSQDEQEEEESEEEHNVCSGLLENDTFHGMIPMEDLGQLLKQNGNYLVRSHEINQDGRKLLISVFWNGQVKNVEIRGTSNQCVTFDGTNIKPTVLELIEFHRSGMIPISAEGVLLGRAIKRQSWELRRDYITQTVKLGEGAFGQVFRGTLKDKMTGQIIDVAIKIPKTKDLSKDLVGEAMKEARIQKDYRHQNIVQLYGVSAEIEPLMIVLEYIDGGSLEDYLKKYGATLNPDYRATMCFDVSCGLDYLHSQHCIHRDIAARNCLIDTSHRIVKISDFGLSSVGTSQAMDVNKPAPIRWLAPEVIKSATYLKSSDIWSLGIVYWEINTNCFEIPYKNYSLLEVRARLTSMTEFHPELPPTTVPEIRNLALKCWNMDYTKRPTAGQCVKELGKYGAPSRYAGMSVGPDLELAQKNRGGQKKKKTKAKQQRKVPSKVIAANPLLANNKKTPSKIITPTPAFLNNRPSMSRELPQYAPKRCNPKSASKSTSSSKGGTREGFKRQIRELHGTSAGSKKSKKSSNERPRFHQQQKPKVGSNKSSKKKN